MTIFSKRPKRLLFPAFLFFVLAGLSIHGFQASAEVKTRQKKNERFQTGKASYFGKEFHGRKTACGRTYNRNHLVAAHPSYPFGTLVRVTNLENDRQVEVRIIDRGPTAARRKKGFIIDLSRAAAEKIGMVRKGRARVRLEVINWDKSHRSVKEEK